MTGWDRDAFMRKYYEDLARSWATGLDRFALQMTTALKTAPHATWCHARNDCAYTPCTCLEPRA